MGRPQLGTVTVAARVAVTVDDWRQAVHAACRQLTVSGAVEAGYADACVASLVTNGPYVVVAPGVALAHARPEDGARSLGLSVAVLRDPVEFGHPTNDPVDVVFAFASPDREQHVGLLAGLSRALQHGLTDDLRGASNDVAATRLLQEVMDDVA